MALKVRDSVGGPQEAVSVVQNPDNTGLLKLKLCWDNTYHNMWEQRQGHSQSHSTNKVFSVSHQWHTTKAIYIKLIRHFIRVSMAQRWNCSKKKRSYCGYVQENGPTGVWIQSLTFISTICCCGTNAWEKHHGQHALTGTAFLLRVACIFLCCHDNGIRFPHLLCKCSLSSQWQKHHRKWPPSQSKSSHLPTGFLSLPHKFWQSPLSDTNGSLFNNIATDRHKPSLPRQLMTRIRGRDGTDRKTMETMFKVTGKHNYLQCITGGYSVIYKLWPNNDQWSLTHLKLKF